MWTGKNILIAEDVDINFMLLNILLKATGANVVRAENGIIAVEKADDKPDIILMDLFMPELSGIEAAKIIKEKYPETPIIAQTALAEEIGEDTQYFDGIVIKPILKATLMETIGKFLDN